MDKKKVGFLGLGNMGFPMARNLIRSGYTVYGVDTNNESERKLAEIGGQVGFTTSTLPSEVNIIFTSLPTPQIVESVYLESGGLIDSGQPGLTLIDLSTISPELNRKVAERANENNIQYLGAPVSGSVSGAETAKLSVMVGGSKDTYNYALPYLKSIGENIFHVSEDHGLGTIVKLINNLMAGVHTQIVAEALSIADAVGLDHDIVYDIVNVSSGQSAVFTRNFKNFIAKDEYYKGSFTTKLLLKDIRLANYISNLHDTKLLLGSTLEKYLETNIDGYADKDMSCVYLMAMKEKAKTVK